MSKNDSECEELWMEVSELSMAFDKGLISKGDMLRVQENYARYNMLESFKNELKRDLERRLKEMDKWKKNLKRDINEVYKQNYSKL